MKCAQENCSHYSKNRRLPKGGLVRERHPEMKPMIRHKLRVWINALAFHSQIKGWGNEGDE
jgi:hypothetical protein